MATKLLRVSWLVRSRKKLRSKRGLNWVDASWSATTVRPRTSAMTVTIVLAMPISRLRASSAVPWKTSGARADPGVIVMLESTEPAMRAATTATVGMAHRAPRRYSRATSRLIAPSYAPSYLGLSLRLTLRLLHRDELGVAHLGGLGLGDRSAVPVIRPAARRSASACRTRVGPLARAGQHDRRDLGAHADLGLGLGLADPGEGLADRRRADGGSPPSPAGRAPSTVGQARAVHRALVPPRPDLLGDVGQQRREQPQHHVEGDAQGRPRGRGLRLALAAVGTVLDQLEVVVAEGPEERLADLERAGVVPGLEARRRLGDDVAAAAASMAPVERVGDAADRSPSTSPPS